VIPDDFRSSSAGDVAVKLMVFDAVSARCVMHSGLSTDDVERTIDKMRLVLRQLQH